MKYILFSILATTSLLVSAQIQIHSNAQSTINRENPFIDASKYNAFTGTNGNIGKGLYFPQTDLTTWEFKTTSINPANFSTYFDGMIVYNKATGNTLADATKGGQQVAVTPGFYYFSNPNQSFPTGNITSGKWVRIGGEESVKAWALGGNTAIQQATIGAGNVVSGDYIGPKDGHALVFATKGTVGSGSTATTGSIARLIIGGEGAGNIIKEPMDGGTKQFDFALKVFGKARFTDGIVTSKSTYPDYVFDNYFTGKSEVNPSYQFMNLDEVEKFIKENNHLPGVTKIDDLSKDGDAYMVDVSETSIQTLEKVEELYLHVIEQQKQIKALKAEIAELKK